MTKGLLCLAAVLLFSAAAKAQTTQGLISGRAVNLANGQPVKGVRIDYTNPDANLSGTASSGESGYFVLPLLSPGLYRIRASAPGFQAQEVQQLELAVAARVDIQFRLRPLSDVWEAGLYRSVLLPDTDAIVTFYGPDVDTSRFGSFQANRGSESRLEVSLSQVIDPAQVRELPLSGRDIYAMLLTQPGVTADTASIRGLGLSAAGQRPTASNFLLDGAENNDYRLTGRLMAVAPEAVQEYRITTSNFSAEYGRTSGFLANAVTRGGTSTWHGLGYYNRRDEALNAATFQRNLRGLGRAPGSEHQGGFQLGGPLTRSRSLLVSTALDSLRSRSEADPVELRLPVPNFASAFTRPDGVARRLLSEFPASALPPAENAAPGALFATYVAAPPVSLDRWLLLERVDYRSPSGRQQLMGRLAISRLSRPDFIWTPYKDFVSGLEQNSTSLAVNWQSTLTAGLTNEARFSWREEDLFWERARSDIPTLVDTTDGVLLPGSPAFYEFDYPNRTLEFTENLLWAQGRHIAKLGGGFLARRIDSRLTAGRDGLYQFLDLLDFGADVPSFLFAPLSRRQLPDFQLPDYQRGYRQNQFFLFAQDTFRVAPRLVLNFGLRYERFGAPYNTGREKDAIVELGPGQGLAQRLAGARLLFPGAGDQRLYGADTNDWAARFGISYDLRGNAATVLRGAYGIYHDRPWDNLWLNVRNNNLVFANLQLPGSPINYLEALPQALRRYQGQRFAGDFPDLTLLDPALRSAYAQNYMLAVQQRLSESWSLEVTGLGSLGRKLLTTDIVNRPGSTPGAGNASRWNPNLFNISWRSNQGSSSYHGLAVAARYRGSRGQFHAAYTWSHAIDNQSDALAGDFFDLSFTGRPSDRPRLRSSFTRQFDSSADRGNSDFDQRHNLVLFSLWDLPAAMAGSRAGVLFRDWKLSQLAAFRTGFPYTLISPSRGGGPQLINNRPDLLRPELAAASGATSVPGGKRLLNAAAFGIPAAGAIGSLGRNALYGPGLVNVDLSLSRSFLLPWLGDGGRLIFRADAYNVLNHANLNAPANILGLPDFGIARYGRRGSDSGFPPLTPLEESARQIQLILRVQF